jgi:hypothetical protein
MVAYSLFDLDQDLIWSDGWHRQLSYKLILVLRPNIAHLAKARSQS